MSGAFNGLSILYLVASLGAIRCWYRAQVRHGKK